MEAITWITAQCLALAALVGACRGLGMQWGMDGGGIFYASRAGLASADGWLRHTLRCTLWRQWKRPYNRARNLMKAGLKEERAFRSAFNQRGPWWNSGASHMNSAFPKVFFDRLGLVSLLDTTRRLQCLS